MDLVAETASSLSTTIRPQAGRLTKGLGAIAQAVLSATSSLVRRVNESSLRRFWEWLAIGFAFRGYTPL